VRRVRHDEPSRRWQPRWIRASWLMIPIESCCGTGRLTGSHQRTHDRLPQHTYKQIQGLAAPDCAANRLGLNPGDDFAMVIYFPLTIQRIAGNARQSLGIFETVAFFRQKLLRSRSNERAAMASQQVTVR
jgi:hypothetical protein